MREVSVGPFGRNIRYYDDPLAIKLLFSSTRLAWLWGILRIWVGSIWVGSALHKVGSPAWVQTGTALRKFWEHAVVVPGFGEPRVHFAWYRDFLHWLLAIRAEAFMGRLIAYGELLVGAAMIVGALVGLAAFVGTFMN